MQSGLFIRSLRRVSPLRQTCRYSSTTTSNNAKPYYITTPIFYPNSGTFAPVLFVDTKGSESKLGSAPTHNSLYNPRKPLSNVAR